MQKRIVVQVRDTYVATELSWNRKWEAFVEKHMIDKTGNVRTRSNTASVMNINCTVILAIVTRFNMFGPSTLPN